MYTGQMDLISLFLYVMLGVCGVVCLRPAKQLERSIVLTKKKSVELRFVFYLLFVLLFTFFATFRKVGENLGGADAYNYVQVFLNAWNPESAYSDLIQEPLIYLYCRVIRMFTDDYRVFFAISYGFIAVSYCAFVEKFCPKNASFLPFLMLVFLYLKAYCTLRTSLAIAVFLWGLILFDRHKWVSLPFFAATIFIHRMSIAFAVFPIFYLLLKNVIPKLTGIRLSAFLFGLGFLGVWAARGLQYIAVNFNILQGSNLWYISKSLGKSLFERFPMFVMHLLLFLAMGVLVEKLEDSPQNNLLKAFCCYDIVIFPATLVLGFWRANEYLYIARLIMWAMLLPKGETLILQTASGWKWVRENSFTQKLLEEKSFRIVYRVGVGILVLAWLVFRICSEADDLKIMPYVLNLF